MFQGGLRVTKQNNIFNLIRNPDATLDDLKKLIELAPKKLHVIEDGLNPLDLAIILNKETMIDFLKEKGLEKTDIETKVITENLYKQVFDNLYKNKSIEELQEILKDKDLSILTISKQITLLDEIKENNINKLIELLKANLNPNLKTNNNIPLIFKASGKNYNVKLLKLALDKGADPNSFTKYYVSQYYGPILWIWLNIKADNDILEGADNDILEGAKYLIEKGADIKYRFGRVSYFYLLYSNTRSIEFYKIFIDAGLDIDDVLDVTGVTMLTISIQQNMKEIFDFFLEKGADVNYKFIGGTPLIIASAQTQILYYVEKLIEKGADINGLSDEGVTALVYAIYHAKSEESVKIIKYLLEHGADKTIKGINKTPLEHAQNNYHKHPAIYKKILALLGNPVNEDIWKGSSRSDIEKYDTFFEKPFDWSCCPICLEYIERSDGCMYMTHNCANTNHHYHIKLYNIYMYYKFEGDTPIIEWCTICGRPTKNHKHYILSLASTPSKVIANIKPEIQERLNRGDNHVFFDNMNCIGFGGGGIEEKATRFRRLREYALELQEDIDKRPYDEVMDELIEEVFNAPHNRNRKIKKILEDKKWNINIKEFPENKRNNNTKNENKNYANIPFNGRLPTKLDPKEDNCIIFGDDDEGKEDNPTYHFHHERYNGINHDGIFICQKDLSRAVEIMNKEFGSERFGKCWFSQCQANLHPEELKGIIPEVLHIEYKKKFNKKMAQKGGSKTRKTRKTKNQFGGNNNDQMVLHKLKLSNAKCLPPNYKLKN